MRKSGSELRAAAVIVTGAIALIFWSAPAFATYSQIALGLTGDPSVSVDRARHLLYVGNSQDRKLVVIDTVTDTILSTTTSLAGASGSMAAWSSGVICGSSNSGIVTVYSVTDAGAVTTMRTDYMTSPHGIGVVSGNYGVCTGTSENFHINRISDGSSVYAKVMSGSAGSDVQTDPLNGYFYADTGAWTHIFNNDTGDCVATVAGQVLAISQAPGARFAYFTTDAQNIRQVNADTFADTGLTYDAGAWISMYGLCDDAGNLWVVDGWHNKVLELSSNLTLVNEYDVTFGDHWSFLNKAYDNGKVYLYDGAGNLDILALPEPATLSLVALGGLALIRRRK